MTAGHCVFSHGNGGWARQIEVIPAMDATSRPFGSQSSGALRSVNGWTNSANPEYDYGAIILPNTSLGNRTGWFGFASLNDSSLRGMIANNSGYPGDKPFGTQWFNSDPISGVSARRLEYMIDTAGGQSGSAVWRYLNGQRHAVGIHGYGGCPNKAVRINQEVFNNMLTWKNV
jgi:V8-like Glu-specific endopeptidase